MNINDKRNKESIELQGKIKAIMIKHSTDSVKQIMQHLKYEHGTIVASRTIRKHRAEIKDRDTKENVKTLTAKRLKEKKEKTEIKAAIKAEKKNDYPYFITSPCDHHVKIKITANFLPVYGCGNCSCTYDRKRGEWFDRNTGYKWGAKAPIVSAIAGAGRMGWFDDSDLSGARESSKRRGFF